MQSPLLQQGAELMFFGMGTVFAFLACLVIITALMSALVQRFAPVKEPQPDQTPVLATSTDDRLIAVISAAVHKYRSRHKP